jgi:hypothetical protein
MKRRLGRAWLERDDAGELRRRRGRPKPGYLDEHAAIVAKDRVVQEVERELAERAAAAERAANAPPTFRAVADAYLDWLERVRGAKPATLRDHRYLLAEPGAAHRRGPGAHSGLIMAALGDRPASEITTRDVNRLLAGVAATGASPRTVNKHRQLVCAVFSFGCQEATFVLPHNPAPAADRRPEPERARLDYYSPGGARVARPGPGRWPAPRPERRRGERRRGGRLGERGPAGRRARDPAREAASAGGRAQRD